MENLISLDPSRKANDPADPAGQENSAEIAASAAQATETGPAVANAVIVGSGPAGYTAAIYLGRAGYSPIVLAGALSPGGQLVNTTEIENFPGFPDGIAGPELMDNMRKQAERFGAQVINDDVISADLKGGIKSLQTDNNGIFRSRTAIITTGSDYRKLEVPGEKEYSGKGVSYCATCDGMFYKNKTVAVVGGGNSAVADALYLSNICTEVYLIHRRGELRASAVYMNALKAAGNVRLVWNSVVSKLLYDKTLTGITVQNVESGETSNIECSGLFVAVGRLPNTALFKDTVELDDSGYIVADESTRTNIPGVFAVGDVRTKALRQIVTACADGAVASRYIEDYIRE